MEFVTEVLEAVVFAAVAFVWMALAKVASDLRVRSTYEADREIRENGNLAVALRRGGLYLGVAIGMLGALSGGGGGFRRDLLEMTLEGAAMVVFLYVALLVSDRVVITGVRNDDVVREGNVAVGLVELGICLATGLIAYASFAGSGGGIASAVVFFALGQVALLVMTLVYERVTPYQVVEAVRNGNAAAGLMLGGMLLAFGFVLHASLLGPFRGWVQDVTAFGASAAMGIALLLLFQWPVDRIFLPGTTLTAAIEGSPNPAAVAVAVAVKIALALVIGAVLL